MDKVDQMTLTFRCPPELDKILPRPIPAVFGLPDWFKVLPQKVFNPTTNAEAQTIKKCPPFIDAMTYGFLMPLPIDLEVREGEFTWNFEVPKGFVSEYSHSPIGFHDPARLPARRSSTKTASSSNSTISGPSKRRQATQYYSPTRSIAPTCHLRRSPASSIATHSMTARSISRRAGMIPGSTVCCRRARRLRNACR